MNLSLTLQFTPACKVYRATDLEWVGDHHVNVNFYPPGEGRTNVTLFVPTIEAADALVDAIAACGAQKTTREEELGVAF